MKNARTGNGPAQACAHTAPRPNLENLRLGQQRLAQENQHRQERPKHQAVLKPLPSPGDARAGDHAAQKERQQNLRPQASKRDRSLYRQPGGKEKE